MAEQLEIEGYTLAGVVFSSPAVELHRGVRDRNGRHVLVHVYRAHDRDDAEGQARQASELSAQLAGPGVPQVLEVTSSRRSPALVVACPAGEPLEATVRRAPLSTEACLELGLGIAAILARIHASHVVHCRIHPGSVFFDTATGEVALVELGFARALGRASEPPAGRGHQSRMGRALAYISPEQTGRMDRGIDTRSDLYGLGATLYFALTGQAPFTDTDAVRLVHAHLAKRPVPARRKRSAVPLALSRIVDKLLEKAPELRYQTVAAVAHDLSLCRDHVRRDGEIPDDLALASGDAPHRPQLSGRIFGRERETEQLLDAFRRACDGRTVSVLLSGPPGVGKSSLIAELRAAVARTDGYLACGKFDGYRHDRPYSAFIDALDLLTQQMLTESESSLAQWRESLVPALGSTAGALVDLVPDLALVLDSSQHARPSQPGQVHARLCLAMQRLLLAVSMPERPLVLWLDDLQWADMASLALLRSIVSAPEKGCVLLVCTHRDDAGPAAADARTTMSATLPSAARTVALDAEEGGAATALELVDELGSELERIALAPISDEACAEILAEALGRSPADTMSLLRVVQHRTGNLPLGLAQTIDHLFDRALLRFEPGIGWTWDAAEIASAVDLPENAIGLLTAKIGRLPQDVVDVLMLASCAGATFSADTLAQLCDRSPAEIERALFTLCDEHLVLPAHRGCRFAHDRVRESAHALLSPERRAEIHHRAARVLLQRTEPAKLASRAQEIATHLELAGDRLNESERVRSLEIGLLASREALRSGASSSGRHHVQATLSRVVEEDWQHRFDLCVELTQRAAECAFHARDDDGALTLLRELAARPLSRMQAARTAAIEVRIETARYRGEQSVELALALLRRFGVSWPRRPSWLRTWLAIRRADRALRDADDEATFRPLGPGDHTAWIAPLIVMGACAGALSTVSTRLMCLLAAFSVTAYRRHGYVQPPALAIATHASYRHTVLGHLGGAEQLAATARAWMERRPNPELDYRAMESLLTRVYAWTQPRSTVLEPLSRVRDTAIERGDGEFAYYASTHRAAYEALIGTPLATVARTFEQHGDRYLRARRNLSSDAYPRAVQILMRAWPDQAELAAEVESVDRLVRTGAFWRVQPWAVWLGILTVLGFRDRVYAMCEEFAGWADEVAICTWSHHADYTFFRGLAAADAAESRAGVRRWRAARVLGRCHRRLRIWARHGPDFAHMATGLEAERARLRGAMRPALRAYAAAARRAVEVGYRHHAALLHERQARLLLAHGRQMEAATALRAALRLYDAWGAVAKTDALRREHPWALARGNAPDHGAA